MSLRVPALFPPRPPAFPSGPILSERVAAKTLVVAGGVYELGTGKVTLV